MSGDSKVVESTDGIEIGDIGHFGFFFRSGGAHRLVELDVWGHGRLHWCAIGHVEAREDVDSVLTLGELDGVLLLVVVDLDLSPPILVSTSDTRVSHSVSSCTSPSSVCTPSLLPLDEISLVAP